MKIKIRQFFLLSAITALLATMMAPASADKPIDFPVAPAEFPSVNPCTGQPHEVTIFFDVFLHLHKDRFLARVVRTGFTSDGYEMFSGTGLQQFNGNTFQDRFVDMWRNVDGQMFQARGNFVVNTNTNEVRVDKFTLRCIGDETVI